MSVTKLDLKSSVCTDNPTGSDMYPFSPDSTQVVQNTGIERNGGVASIYEQQTTFTTAGQSTMIAKDGTVVQIDSSSNVLLDNNSIGNVGTIGIYQRGALFGYVDAAWTSATVPTILAITKVSNTISVYELDPSNSLATINSRSTTFATLPSGSIRNVFLVKYVDMKYADNQEFIIDYSAPIPTGVTSILKESGATSASLTAHSWSLNTCWRFATASYIIGYQSPFTDGIRHALAWYYGNDLTATMTILDSSGGPGFTNCTIDRFPGTAFSRALLTRSPSKLATNTYSGLGILGYTSAGTFSSLITEIGTALATASTVTLGTALVGQGYMEGTYSRSDIATTYYIIMANTYGHTATLASNVYASITNSLTSFNGYARITDIYNTTSSAYNTNLVSLRICWTDGVPGYLSAAYVGSVWDCIGVPITNLGEYDNSYTVFVDDDGSTKCRFIYRSSGVLYYVDLRPSLPGTLSKVSDDLYTVNSITPINAIVISKKALLTGRTDYNGRILFAGIASAIQASTKMVGVIQGAYANSFDTGDIITTSQQATPTSIVLGISFVVPGIEQPSFVDRKNDYGVNIYFNDVYFMTAYSFSGGDFLSDFISNTYIPDTRLPVAIGYPFGNHVVNTEVETIFTGVGATGSADINYSYLAYETGNDTPGQYQSFVLFGQTYVFDGNNIWLITFNGSLFNGKGNSPIAPATGMTFISVSPVEAYFLSSFDYSLYVFNGGRSLQKMKRMNDLRNSSNVVEPILNGVYNVRDNALLLQTASTFVWIRDGVVTANNKKANQIASTVNLYDTQNGIQIANNTIKWQYSFSTMTSSTVVPLTWQSAYHSLQANETSELINWIVTVYSPDGRISAPLTLTCYSFDQEKYNTQAAQTININPGDWDGLGFFRARIQPKNRKAIASSLQIDTTKHLVITDVSVEYTDQGKAAIAGARSK